MKEISCPLSSQSITLVLAPFICMMASCHFPACSAYKLLTKKKKSECTVPQWSTNFTFDYKESCLEYGWHGKLTVTHLWNHFQSSITSHLLSALRNHLEEEAGLFISMYDNLSSKPRNTQIVKAVNQQVLLSSDPWLGIVTVCQRMSIYPFF